MHYRSVELLYVSRWHRHLPPALQLGHHRNDRTGINTTERKAPSGTSATMRTCTASRSRASSSSCSDSAEPTATGLKGISQNWCCGGTG